LKIHLAVDVKSKKVFSVKVTDDEHVHDSKMLPQLIGMLQNQRGILQ